MVDILLLIIEVGTNWELAESQCSNTFHIIESYKNQFAALALDYAYQIGENEKRNKRWR